MKNEHPRWWDLQGHICKEVVETIDEWLENGVVGFPISTTYEEWLEIIKKIRNGFADSIIITDMLYDEKDFKRLKASSEEGRELFHKHFFNLWD